MKLLTTILLAGLVLNSTQAVEYIRGQNVSIKFTEGEGTFQSDSVEFANENLTLSADSEVLPFSFKDGRFQIGYYQFSMDYNFGQGSILEGIQDIQSESLSFHYVPGALVKINTGGLFLKHTKGEHFIPRLTIDCKKSRNKSLVNDVLYPCLNLGRLDLPYLNFDEISGKAVAGALNQTLGLDKIEDVLLTTYQGSYQLQFKAKILFNWKVKATGSIDYDATTSELRIHLDSAKVGFLSVKRTLLSKLSEAEIESVRLQGDHIYIKI